ncbi:hypothetical protein AAEX28_08975 [Lentisphaerota bacterium WC36G]|nr:hypothetical protein LJT99_11825 [Lentisphaerae bacterium WC36]
MLKICIVLCLGLILAVSGCVNSYNRVQTPYKASAERFQQIINAQRVLRVNDTEERVLKIAGEPDEVRNISTSLDSTGERVGYAFIYLIQRQSEHGSIIQRGEKNLKIIFNNNNIVTRIESNGGKF